MIVLDSECPKCGPVRSDVINSRAYEMNGIATRMRRRQCCNCDTRFTTYELSPEVAEIAVNEASKIDLLMGMIRASGIETGVVFERFVAEVQK